MPRDHIEVLLLSERGSKYRGYIVHDEDGDPKQYFYFKNSNKLELAAYVSLEQEHAFTRAYEVLKLTPGGVSRSDLGEFLKKWNQDPRVNLPGRVWCFIFNEDRGFLTKSSKIERAENLPVQRIADTAVIKKSA